MKRLTGSKQVFAVAGAILLVAAASSSALAMIDSGQTSAPKVQVQRPVKQNAASQAQQSPLPTPEPTSTPGSHGNEVEFRGTVEVIATTGWVIDGRTVQVTGDTMAEIGIDIGSVVKVHAQRQADGSLVASKIELVQNGGGDDGNGNGNENENENENENHNGNVNSNDDGDDDHNGNGNMNSNGNGDDHGNDNGNVNSNDAGDDDHSGNSNDNEDHGGNDDHGGNGNSNDDHGGKGRG